MVRLTAALGMIALAGCGDAVTAPEEALDLDALFAPPSAPEVEAVVGDWETRDLSPAAVRVELDSLIADDEAALRVEVLSHLVGGLRHFGAVVTPVGANAGSLPVIVYAHGGDGGVTVEEALLVGDVLRSRGHMVALVVPSFRDESLRLGERTYRSDGPPSPWDRDVDDAISLLSAAIDHAAELDPQRIGIVGVSRGGGVGLLMGARDPRIDAVVEFFGPTDFFGDFVREIFEEALEGKLRDLPGLDYLNETVIQPWKNGTLSTGDARREMVRRSALYFVDRLPAVQLHHGTEDQIVAVSQAERLIWAMKAAGRTGSDFDPRLYDGAGHDLFALSGATGHAVDFLARHVIEAAPAVDRARSRR